MKLVRRVWTPPERVFRHLHFEGTFRTTVDGLPLYLGHHGFEIENRAFWLGMGESWEPLSLRLWVRLCREARSVVDVGANLGFYTLAARAANAGARIAAFEPVERVRGMLEENLALNGFQADVRGCALGGRDGEVEMVVPDEAFVIAASVNRTYGYGEEGRRVTVSMRRLDSLVDAGEVACPDLVKIDVEGAEPDVLDGMAGFLHEAPPTLLVEVLDAEVSAALQDRVRGIDYRFYELDEEAGPRKRDRIVHARDGNYLLCLPEVAVALRLE